MEATKLIDTGAKKVFVIDGVDGNHRVEDRVKTQLFADETKRLCRTVRREYNKDRVLKNTVINDINERIVA